MLDLSLLIDPMSGPLSNGFEIAAWLRDKPESRAIPIVIMSVTEPSEYRARFKEGEIAAFIQKPLDKKEMLRLIRVVLAVK